MTLIIGNGRDQSLAVYWIPKMQKKLKHSPWQVFHWWFSIFGHLLRTEIMLVSLVIVFSVNIQIFRYSPPQLLRTSPCGKVYGLWTTPNKVKNLLWELAKMLSPPKPTWSVEQSSLIHCAKDAHKPQRILFMAFGLALIWMQCGMLCQTGISKTTTFSQASKR